MSFLVSAGFSIFILLLFAGIFLNLFGLPGTVIIFFDVLFYAIFTGFDQIGWKIILFLFVFTIISETIEVFFFMGGLSLPIASQKSLGAAVIGALLGILLLTPFWGGPGIWLGFFLGGLAGTLIIEFINQSKLKAPFKMPGRTVLAMIGGKMFKGLITLSMIAVSLSNIYS